MTDIPLTESPFASAARYQPRGRYLFAGVPLPHDFGDVAAEYRAAHESAVVVDRNDRGLLVVRGKDRAAWLHNLLTNVVATLDAGAGNYAFAINAKGRTLFDVNVLCTADALWLDLGRSVAVRALQHLEGFHITEDIELADRSDAYTALTCLGPRASALAAACGVTNFTALPALGHAALDAGARLVRQDCGRIPGFLLSTPIDAAASWWSRLEEHGARPAGTAAYDALRIEAAIPVYGHDIDEAVLPPETGRIEAGISYTKGCYLGYEIMERMRSRGAVARRLVRVAMPSADAIALPAPLVHDGKEVGRITSLVSHPVEAGAIGLGYVKSTVSDDAELACDQPPRPVRIMG